MKISEVISELVTILKEHGDLEVVSRDLIGDFGEPNVFTDGYGRVVV